MRRPLGLLLPASSAARRRSGAARRPRRGRGSCRRPPPGRWRGCRRGCRSSRRRGPSRYASRALPFSRPVRIATLTGRPASWRESVRNAGGRGFRSAPATPPARPPRPRSASPSARPASCPSRHRPGAAAASARPAPDRPRSRRSRRAARRSADKAASASRSRPSPGSGTPAPRACDCADQHQRELVGEHLVIGEPLAGPSAPGSRCASAAPRASRPVSRADKARLDPFGKLGGALQRLRGQLAQAVVGEPFGQGIDRLALAGAGPFAGLSTSRDGRSAIPGRRLELARDDALLAERQLLLRPARIVEIDEADICRRRPR